jgi:hypothetical protein
LSNLAICITEGIPVRHAGSARNRMASEAAGKRYAFSPNCLV